MRLILNRIAVFLVLVLIASASADFCTAQTILRPNKSKFVPKNEIDSLYRLKDGHAPSSASERDLDRLRRRFGIHTRVDHGAASAVMCYLGQLKCVKPTRGAARKLSSLVEAAGAKRGNDQLRIAYGVLVKFSDGSYRAWGNVLESTEANSNYRHGPFMERPIFIYRRKQDLQPSEIDITTPGKTLAHVRVAIVAWEKDTQWKFPPSVDLRGISSITERLRRKLRESGAPGFDGFANQSPFGDWVLTATQKQRLDDTIGISEWLFKVEDLNRPGWATRISRVEELDRWKTPIVGRRANHPPLTEMRRFFWRRGGSDYRGGLWLVEGPRAEMEKQLRKTPHVFVRSMNYVKVQVRNVTGHPQRIQLSGINPFPRISNHRRVREGGSSTIHGDAKISDVLQPGRARIYQLASAEDDLWFHRNSLRRPEEGRLGTLQLTPPERVRHLGHYLITNDGITKIGEIRE